MWPNRYVLSNFIALTGFVFSFAVILAAMPEVSEEKHRRNAGPPASRQAKGQNMSDAQLNDVDYESALTREDVVAATAIAQFYNFASRCLDWAKTTRSLQERAVYVQMGLQWLAAGARMQTSYNLRATQGMSLKESTEVRKTPRLTPSKSQLQSDHPVRPDRTSNLRRLHEASHE